MLVCDNKDAARNAALSHLIDEVQVPAILATLKPGDLLAAYQDHVDQDVFYFSPVSVNGAVARADDDGHIWNLLGQPSDYVPAYVKLLELSETHLRAVWTDLKDATLRVALITTDQAFGAELRDLLLPALRFNGKSVVDNGDAFMSVTVEQKPNLPDLAQRVGEFEPDIIISAASEAFLMTGGVQEQIESDWEFRTDKRRPFYILSPYDSGNLGPLTVRISAMIGSMPTVNDNERYVGVTTAGAADPTLQNGYNLRLHSSFPDAILDSANYYDAVYFLAYAMYAANQTSITGSGIAAGMQRLLMGPDFAVGKNINDVFQALMPEGSTIHLQSTYGPPDFDGTTGVRAVDGGVLCFRREGTTARETRDVLRYDRATQTFVGDDFPCISGFFQP